MLDEANIPTPEEVKAQLSRILASDEFKNSGRLTSFLRHIVHKTLEGAHDDLKGYTIGIDIFGKGDDFNPELDASVRGEATRLRKALSIYYHDKGRYDPVVITVAKGSYRPSFFYNIIETPVAQTAQPIAHAGFTWKHALLILLLIGFVAVAFISGKNDPIDGLKPRTTMSTELPSLAVLPFYTIGGDEAESFGRDLADKLVQKFIPFHALKTQSGDNLSQQKFWQRKSAEIAQGIGADYVIEGTVHKNKGIFNISLRLLDIVSGTYAWSHNYSLPLDPEDVPAYIDDLSSRVVGHIASPYGIIDSLERARAEDGRSKASMHLQCVLEYHAYSNRKSPAGHKHVRDCLEETVKEDPGYGDAWAALSWVYGDEARMNYNVRESIENARKRSLEAAQKGIQADMSSARTHQYMALAAQLNDKNEDVRKHTEIALSLNPNDSEVLADAAWSLCQLQDWDRCRDLGERAMELNPLHPDWYHMGLFIYYYRVADYEQALLHALKYHQPDFLWSNILLAAAYAGANKGKEAREIAAHINKNFPEFKSAPLDTFKAWNMGQETNDKIMAGVIAAGVELAPNPDGKE